MDSTAGHSGALSIQSQISRKEWRVVSEGSGKDGSNEEGRVNVSGMARASSGVSRQGSSNGRIFHSASSASSIDSDHLSGEFGSLHVFSTLVSPQDLAHQNIGQGEDARMYNEALESVSPGSTHERIDLHQIYRVRQKNEHLDSAMNGLLIDSGGPNSPDGPEESLQHRLHEVITQREHLQQMETEIRAQFIARAEVLRLQGDIDEQIKQHANVVTNLQEQLQDRDHRIHDLEQRLEEREKQLCTNEMEANEAVWAKDGLLREQNNELANLRQDRDNAIADKKTAVAQIEAERAQYLAQLQDLKDQVQEKEHQIHEIDEQRRNIQDVLIYKDEQLRERQAWMQRAQELDAFHANANSSLHAELRDRMDQMNQLWLGYQRQLAEVERFHVQTIQRLQLEIAETKEQNRLLRGAVSGDSSESKDEQSSQSGSKETGHINGIDQVGAHVTKISAASTIASSKVKLVAAANGTADGARLIVLQREAPTKVEHATGLPVVGPTPVLGMAPVLTSGPVVLRQFGALQQGSTPTLQPAQLQIPQPHLGPFQSVPGVTTLQHLPASQLQKPQQHPHAQRYAPRQQQHHVSHQLIAKSQPLQQPRLNDHPQQQLQHDQGQRDFEQGDAQRHQVLTTSQPSISPTLQHPSIQQSLHHLQDQQSIRLPEQSVAPSQVLETHQEGQQPRVSSTPIPHLEEIDQQQQQEETSEQCKEQNGLSAQQSEDEGRNSEQSISQAFPQQQQSQILLFQNVIELNAQPLQHQLGISSSGEQFSGSPRSAPLVVANEDTGNFIRMFPGNKQVSDCQDTQKSLMQPAEQSSVTDGGSNSSEPMLLDEKSLLACLVRVIPGEPTAQIRISTTLPNRLGKMLAPLHWHDYKKQYGRLDEFVGSHPELFIIEGDFIYLRQGAHAIVSATTAVIKAAAVAAALSVHSNRLPTVAVTPVAQSQLQRLRNSKGLILSQKEIKQDLSAAQNLMQTTNAQIVSSFSNSHSVGSLQSTQRPIVKSTEEDGNTNQGQVGSSVRNSDAKADGGQIMTMMGPRPHPVTSNGNSMTRKEFKKAIVNGYESSGAVNARNGIMYHGNRQTERSNIMRSGCFGNEDMITRPQTQESRISQGASSAAH